MDLTWIRSFSFGYYYNKIIVVELYSIIARIIEWILKQPTYCIITNQTIDVKSYWNERERILSEYRIDGVANGGECERMQIDGEGRADVMK